MADLKPLGDVAAEVEMIRHKDNTPTGQWRFSIFLDGSHVSDGAAATVPEAAYWCLHRARRNAARIEEVLKAMGLPTEPPNKEPG